MTGKLTPLLSQYRKIKERYPGTILLFRVGDFYEMFYEDAEIGARALNLTLTSRPHGKNNRIPLAGVPAKSLDTYISRLVEQGFKVAVCEQLEPPSPNKPVVLRDVVEVITPGTLTRDTLLDQKRNNYLMALSPAGDVWGMAFADLSTGEFSVTEMETKLLPEEIAKISPAEILVPQTFNNHLLPLPPTQLTRLDDYYFSHEFGFEKLTSHFGVINLGGFGIEHLTEGICAAGAIVHYLEQTQCTALPHLRRISPYQTSDKLLIDRISRRNLELLETLHPLDNKNKTVGTLLWVLDKTRTPVGARLLRRWIVAPLVSVEKIKERLDAVEELCWKLPLEELTRAMGQIGDLERVASRIALERATPRDMVALSTWLGHVPKIKNSLANATSELLVKLREGIPDFNELVEKISVALVENPPPFFNEGGVIRAGYSQELDELREIAGNTKAFIARLQDAERLRTGIPNLRIGYNSVFGYYIEVTKSYLHLVPADYIRKQTVVNAERFITPELKDYENKVLNAEEKIKTLEYELFVELRRKVKEQTDKILDFAAVLGELDVLASFAQVARERNYKRPAVDNSTLIEIKAGRHPVVEAMSEEPFIPNDLFIDTNNQQILIITGPNMAGKSTYLRQVALIVIMAQMGSFVPAESARIGIVDKIFTRIGASDDVARGVSTFLAEMTETANILNNATNRSLVILDEVGRGTSTNDGVAIAWATVEYLHGDEKFRPRTLFATHYQELTRISSLLPRVKNYSFLVRESGEEVIFLRKIHPGPADKSYGIAVAKLAGLPYAVIQRAKDLLVQLGQQEEQFNFSLLAEPSDLPVAAERPHIHPVISRLRNLNINELSPLQALNLLAELQRLANE